ncbi:hypothetical protein D3C80_1989680 [compost metagenome]
MLHLIADTPHKDARMIPVALHHPLQITLPLRLEVTPISPAGPFVKRLLVHQQAQLITQVQ